MAYEDLTTFTKWGAQQAKITFLGTDRSIITTLLRSDEAILYKDYGVGHFALAGGIEHDFDFYIDNDDYGGGAGNTSTFMQPWALANAVNDLEALKQANENFLTITIDGNNIDNRYTLTIIEWKNNARFVQDTSVLFNQDVQIFIKQTIVGNTWNLGMYSTLVLRNAGDGTDGDIDNLTAVLSSAVLTFRYLYSVMSRDAVGWLYWITAWQQQYDLHEAVPTLKPFPSNIATSMRVLDMI